MLQRRLQDLLITGLPYGQVRRAPAQKGGQANDLPEPHGRIFPAEPFHGCQHLLSKGIFHGR